jgi:hypothetical protein
MTSVDIDTPASQSTVASRKFTSDGEFVTVGREGS